MMSSGIGIIGAAKMISEDSQVVHPHAGVRMKRGVGFLVVVLLSSNVFAPPKIDAQTTVGVQGGFTLATFGGTNAGGYDQRAGVNVCVFLDLSQRLKLVATSVYSLGLRTLEEFREGVTNRVFSTSVGLAMSVG